MDEAQAPVVRRRRTLVEAEQLVAEYEASDMGRQEFCRKHGLALVTLDRYRRRLRKAQSVSSGQGRWLVVELSGHQQANPQGAWSGLALILTGGKRIQAGGDFDARTLLELVRALGSF